MSDEYERWLIARQNVFAPSPDAIVKLVATLRAEKWIIDPASAELATFEFKGARERLGQKTGAYAIKRVENTFGKDRDGLFAKIAASTESVPADLDAAWLKDSTRDDLNLVWSVSAPKTSLKYPLTRRPDGPVSYRFEIHRAHDFVYPASDTIDALDTECRCGNELAFDWDPDEWESPFGASSGIHTECNECSRTFDPAQLSANVVNPFDDSDEKEVRGGGAYRFAIKIDCRDKFVRDPKLAFAPELVALLEKEFGRQFYEVGSVY
jgi:hypothetical protein